MKQIAIVLALGVSMWATAFADQPGGLSGTVVDAKSGQPIANAQLYYYRSPYLENGANHVMTLRTNRNGFFSDINLQPGRYVVMAKLPGKVEGCAIDDVMAGEVARVRMVIGRDEIMCSGPRVSAAMVDPNASGDVYRI
jgi:hypothetical protein